MRRSRIVVILFILVVMSVGTFASRAVGAQEATPPTASGHPLVGGWLMDGDADDPANPLESIVFTADGLYIGADVFGGNTIGVWAPTGARTAALTLVFPVPGSNGASGGMVRVRGTVEVAADGRSFTAPYTLEIAAPDGARSGEYGPGTATGTRMAIEPMGEPRGPLAELWGALQTTPTP